MEGQYINIRTTLKGGVSSMLQQNGDCHVGCSLHRCDVGPCNAKGREKKALSELCPSDLRQVLGLGSVGF